MKRPSVCVLTVLAGVVLLALSIEAAQDCCFTNPRFTGTCRVTPGPDESCAGILAYLNNPVASGKEYCRGTTLRGGWSQVDCETKPDSPSPTPGRCFRLQIDSAGTRASRHRTALSRP